MNVHEAIKKRWAVRNYRPNPVPEESLNKILEAARLAPSAHNKQGWKFIVVKDSSKRKKLSKASGQDFLAKAPIIIAGVALDPDYIMDSEVPAYAVNLGIAMEHIALSAVEEGLGTCWIGRFSQKEAKEVLKIPEKYKIVALMPIGFPADKSTPKFRKDLKKIACYE